MAPRPTPTPIYSPPSSSHHSMAPAVPALGEAGPSSWHQQQQQQLLLARGAALARRSRSHSPVFTQLGVIASDGSFNGSCASTTLSGMPLEAPQGSCASYFPDITAYCCSGIGGTLVEVTYQDDEEDIAASASSSTSSASSSSSTPQAICQTSDYSDALACFQLTAETNCKTGQTGLYGVCNTDGADTSTVTTRGSSDSSTASTRAATTTTDGTSSSGGRVASYSTIAGGAQEYTPAAAMEAQSMGGGGGSNGAGASMTAPGWKASWGLVGVVLVSLALQA